MSSDAVSWVLNHADAQGAERLVLIVLADHAGEPLADNQGATYFEAWPGVERIAEQARLDSVRTVKNALARLAQTGQIQRLVNAAPDHRIRSDRRPNLYRILTRPRPLHDQIEQRFELDDIARHPALQLDRERAIGDTHNGGGVSRDDTPQPSRMIVDNSARGVAEQHPAPQRGVVSRRDGVSSDDATGCRRATPKPLEEPLEENPLPNVPRAELSTKPAVENPAANDNGDEHAELPLADRLAQRAAAVPRHVVSGHDEAVGE